MPAGLPAKAVNFMVLMPKTRWYYTAGSTMSGQRDHFFGKRVPPSFPVGMQIENRPSHSVLQAGWKGGVRPTHSFGAWESPWETGPGLDTGVQNESPSKYAGGGRRELRGGAEIKKSG